MNTYKSSSIHHAYSLPRIDGGGDNGSSSKKARKKGNVGNSNESTNLPPENDSECKQFVYVDFKYIYKCMDVELYIFNFIPASLFSAVCPTITALSMPERYT